MRWQWRKSILGFLVLLMFLPMTTSCLETEFGGMSVNEAFPDARVAKLVEAVGDGDYTEADRQQKAGADINRVGTDGVSPLLWVLNTHNLEGVEYMLKTGADPNYRTAKSNFSAMYVVAGGDKPEFLELLLRYKGDPNLVGPREEPLLHIAVGQFRKENIDILLRHGADINITSGPGPGITAAHDAVALGRFDLAAYFLEQGLNVNLDGLARYVESRRIPPDSEGQSWKNKVIEMLKARGVKYPPDNPKKPKGSSNR